MNVDMKAVIAYELKIWRAHQKEGLSALFEKRQLQLVNKSID